MSDKYRNNVLEFCDAAKKTGSFFIFDTETTGLDSNKDEVIEFSAIKYDFNRMEEIDRLDIYIKPSGPLEEIIVELTGITDEFLETCGLEKADAVQKIHEFLGAEPVIAGYNSIAFDRKFMEVLYKDYGFSFKPLNHLDVIKMAKEKMEKPYKLIDVVERTGEDISSLKFHSSIDDAQATFMVLRHLLPLYEEAEAVDSSPFVITKIAKWDKVDGMKRIYVNNSDKTCVFYDVTAKEWVIKDNHDTNVIISSALSFAGVSSEEEFIRKYS